MLLGHHDRLARYIDAITSRGDRIVSTPEDDREQGHEWTRYLSSRPDYVLTDPKAPRTRIALAAFWRSRGVPGLYVVDGGSGISFRLFSAIGFTIIHDANLESYLEKLDSRTVSVHVDRSSLAVELAVKKINRVFHSLLPPTTAELWNEREKVVREILLESFGSV